MRFRDIGLRTKHTGLEPHIESTYGVFYFRYPGAGFILGRSTAREPSSPKGLYIMHNLTSVKEGAVIGWLFKIY